MKKSVTYLLYAVVILAGIAIMASAQAEDKMKFAGEEMLPPNAKPGECYARVFVPPTYKTVSEMTLRKEASESLIIEEPKFETVNERVMVKAASERLETIPAVFEWVEEQVLIQPEHKHLEEVAAVYKTVTEQVLDQPAHTVWKKGTGPIQKIDNSTGEIMCLIEIPATYKTISKRVLVSNATTREIITPAKYTTVRSQVMRTPPTVRRIEIPAEYTTVQARRMISPALAKSVAIPEEFQTVSRQEMLTEGNMEWRPVLCETNTTTDLISSLQRALDTAGYNPGPIDGDFGSQTMSAVRSYQKDKGLPVGQLTLETLSSLGIRF